MNTINPVSCHFRLLGLGVLLSLFANSVQSGATSLATEPFTSTSRINSLPNVVFVLDDSGSMDLDYLPDWAGPWKNVSNVLITPSHRFFNSAYNGVAYNPATRYRPPVMYSSVGALDTTTYPSMDGSGTASGGDASASSTSRNWRAVKKDGYGIQSTATVNIEGNAYYYTTTAGEYCTTAALRTCTAATAASGSYTFPAKLRWCTTSVKSLDTTANSNGFCQASNIADTPTNTANGVTNYTYPRIAGIRTATVTVSASTTVTGITVGGVQIMSGSAAGGSADAVATAIATQINACTYGLPTTTSCGTVGYSATVASNVVTITAPGASSATPVVTGGSTTVTAFSGNSVPGQTALTVITPSVTSYPKSTNRTDCSGSTCTYAEEMTNYANWYAYYRTRMQMMKTAASIAFSSVDDKFRVGYFTINNGSTALTGGDFLNVSAFDGTQKHAWYSMFFLAKPFGPTPLRTGLSKAGRMYAGKLSTLNGQSVTDPMQYSCQQNFTILSTDGYWNDASDPVQVDGSTAVGQQDGSDPRPYYDGATYTRTSSQTTRTDTQVGQNSFIVESQTQQLQETRARLDESVTTTTTYPYQLESTPLQVRTTPLNQTTRNLESRTYPLTQSSYQLRQRTALITSTPEPLNTYINNLTQTTTPLEARTYKVTKSTQLITKSVYNLTKGTQQLTKKDYNITKGTQLVTKSVYNLTVGTRLITKSVYNLTKNTYPLQQSVYRLTKNTRQLQKRQQVSTDGGDTWSDTGWVDANTCSVTTTGVVTVVSAALWTRNTTCQYATAVTSTAQSSCTSVAASTGPTNYTVAQAVTCAWEAPAVTSVASCTAAGSAGAGPTYNSYTTCGYSGTATTQTGQTSCSPLDQTGSGTMTGDKVTCAFDSTPTNTTGLSTCTFVVPASATSPKTTCSYQSTTTQTGQTSCTVANAGTATTNGTVYNTATTCAFDTTPTNTTNLSTCTNVNSTSGGTPTSPKTTCAYQSTTNLTGQTTCTAATAASGSTTGTVYNTAVTCSWDSSPTTTTTNLSSCTWNNPASATTAPKTTCEYQAATNATGQTSCTVVPQGTVTATGTVWNSATTCAFDATPTNTTGQSTCTNANSTSGGTPTLPKTTCAYEAATTLAGQNSCTTAAAASGSTTGTVYNTAVSCTYDATPSTTLTNQSSCTWVVPATAASSPRTDCVYNAAAATTATVSTCTTVNQSIGTTNGTVWSGPAVACNYNAAVLQTANVSTCTWGAPSAGPVFTAYTSCAYTTGTPVTNQNSCTVVPRSTGVSTGTVWSGPANACAYQALGSNVNVTSCTWAAQSPTFAAPQVSCNYAGASNSTVTSCTVVPKSTGTATGTTWSGPARDCAYSGTASATNTNVTTCTANRQTASPYTGPAVDCTYAAGTTLSSNVASCTAQAQSAGPTNYVGPEVTCAYGTPSAWANATATCNAQAQSAGPAYTGPAVECAYNASGMTTSLVGNSCTEVLPSSGPSYSVLTKEHCVAGAFPVVTGPVVTTVDSCSTAPTSNTNATTGINVATATTCNYRAPVTTNVGACTAVPASGSSPYVTSVSCASPIGSWTPVAPSCSLIGTVDATTPTFNASGTAVNCRKTDTVGVTSTADYNTFSLVTTPPVAACTASTNPTTKEQTRCTTLLSTGPDPVQTCTPADPPVAPDYVKTVCTPVVSTATSMGCAPQTATAPLWQTVTCTYNAGSGTENTLADVAAYYYKTDLRTSALNNCVGAPVAPATTGSDVCLNNVPTSSSDPNTSQHMTTFTLGLGASGYMKYSDTYPTDTSGDFYTVKGVSPYAPENGITADPSNGVCSWQSSGNCNWPFPSSNEQTTIDDLWHAGVNGRGAYFSATDPVSLANSISSALSGVAAAGGAAAAPALSTPSLVPADSYVFSSTFTTSDWTGEVARRQIDPFTGSVSPTNDWAVQAKLDAKSASTRNIYVFDNSVATTKLKAFTSANYSTNTYFNTPHISTAPNGLTQFLCASTDICLSSTDQDSSHASGANLVEYLRGVRTNEGAERDNAKYYRARQHVLGDLVNAQVVYVTKPKYEYADPGYTAFVSAQSSRQAVAYAGANDGMLHAFAAKGSAATEALVEAAATANAKAYLDPSNASLAAAAATATTAANAAVAADTVVGQELWAFIPATVLPNLYKLADKRYRDKHRPYVDATPVVGDVCISDCAATTAVWKTILVGGLGRGGRGYYALDITDPASPKALWEFTDANLGYTFGNPEITKLADGTWVVMFASGYNNIPNDDGAGGDGVGRLYVLNAYSGTQVSGVSPISTGVGGTSSPSGLVKITAQVVNPRSDNTTEAVYGGDLLGNLWRFDVNDAIGANGYDAQLLATLSDGAGNAQPVTTKPEVGLIEGYKVVFVGTGRYLAASDATDTSTQTLYAIKDPRAPLTTPSSAIFSNPGGSPRVTGNSTANFIRQVMSDITCPAGNANCAAGELVRTITSNPVSFVTNNGWFVDLIGSAERANTDPALALGLLAFNTNAPSLVACDVGGKSYSYFLDYLTGGPIYGPGNNNSTRTNGVAGVMLANELASSPALAVTKGGKLIILSGLSGGGIASKTPPQPAPASVTRRTSWRELIRGN